MSDGNYDVVIVGGAMMGASAAFHLVRAGFAGRIAVIERDPSYEFASTTHTNSCMRQQFSSAINVRVSRFTAQVVRDFPGYVGDERAPPIHMDPFGYLYLAADPQAEAALRAAHAVQQAEGAATELLSPAQIAVRWPFYALEDIRLGSHNPVDEGYFDGALIFEWFKRLSREGGAEWITGEVTGIERAASRVTGVTLKDGRRIGCGWLVNAAGPRAADLARMAGLSLPVEPRKRHTFVFRAADALPARLPLTIDPSGVHMRSDGALFMAGCPPLEDGPVAVDDFAEDHEIWEDRVWPALAARVPAFEAIRLERSWVGHYAYNPVDRNAILGPHPELGNFLFCNGFSGHGLQQAPAMGRGLAEWITAGRYQTLDLTPFGFERLVSNRPMLERAVI